MFAFSDCYSLTSITFPGSLTGFDLLVFQLSGLTSISFQNNINQIEFDTQPFAGLFPMNIYIPGNFNVASYDSNSFPEGSHLYITSKTVLSDSCRYLFGSKSVIVHFLDMTQITHETTKSVIDFIAIKIVYPKRSKNFIHDKSSYLFLINLLSNVNLLSNE